MSVTATAMGGTVTASCTAAPACTGTPTTTLTLVGVGTIATGTTSAMGSVSSVPAGTYTVQRDTVWPDPVTCPTLTETVDVTMLPLESYDGDLPRLATGPTTHKIGVHSDDGRRRL